MAIRSASKRNRLQLLHCFRVRPGKQPDLRIRVANYPVHNGGHGWRSRLRHEWLHGRSLRTYRTDNGGGLDAVDCLVSRGTAPAILGSLVCDRLAVGDAGDNRGTSTSVRAFALSGVCLRNISRISLGDGMVALRCDVCSRSSRLVPALAAPQLLPAMELASASVRHEMTFAAFKEFALPPAQVLTLLFPYLFGGGAPPVSQPFIGQWNLAETMGYVGLLPLMLAAIGSWCYRGERLVVFWIVVALVAFLLALGDRTPLLSVTLLFAGDQQTAGTRKTLSGDDLCPWSASRLLE